MKKFFRSEKIKNLLWMFFGFFGGFSYFSKEQYWISGILFLVGILYTYELVKTFRKDQRI
ncbi:hypothetical protein HC174_08800 [Salinimicrobium sp. CDJ15-81-2]|nr:hypothetical protein [Salinimicrobium nanhaiense]